mmetsp:Transcript_27631/g.41819  ORF Transcript_27631/g.41819 Transcript_27631/m.41819 type:complete len:401 (-) Transcript_27631:2562-3764(-)
MRSIWKIPRDKYQSIEWFAFYSKSSGREYYFNPKTNVVTWILPDDEHSDGEQQIKLKEIRNGVKVNLSESKTISEGDDAAGDSSLSDKDFMLFGTPKSYRKRGTRNIRIGQFIAALAILIFFFVFIVVYGWIVMDRGDSKDEHANADQPLKRGSKHSINANVLPSVYDGKESKGEHSISSIAKPVDTMNILGKSHVTSDLSERILVKQDDSPVENASDPDSVYCSLSDHHSCVDNGSMVFSLDKHHTFRLSKLVEDENKLCINPFLKTDGHQKNTGKSYEGDFFREKRRNKEQARFSKPYRVIDKMPLLRRFFSAFLKSKIKHHDYGNEHFVEQDNEAIIVTLQQQKFGLHQSSRKIISLFYILRVVAVQITSLLSGKYGQTFAISIISLSVRHFLSSMK